MEGLGERLCGSLGFVNKCGGGCAIKSHWVHTMISLSCGPPENVPIYFIRVVVLNH